MRLYMWEQVTHLFAVIKRGIKHFRKELHQMVLALEFSARDWVEYDTSDYGKEDNYDAAIGGSAENIGSWRAFLGLTLSCRQPVQERSLVLASGVTKPDDQQESARQYW